MMNSACSAYLYKVILCLIVLSCLPGSARGDEQITPALKSERTATAISIGATVIPVALAIPFLLSDNPDTQGGAAFLTILALVFGPATGHQYADNGKKMALALVIRAPLLLMTGTLFISDDIGYYVNAGNAPCLNDCYSSVTRRPFRKAAYVIGALCAATMIYDIATAGRSVRAYNARLTDPQTRIYPYSIVGLQGIRAGLALHF